jgi:hypothetical protein
MLNILNSLNPPNLINANIHAHLIWTKLLLRLMHEHLLQIWTKLVLRLALGVLKLKLQHQLGDWDKFIEQVEKCL